MNKTKVIAFVKVPGIFLWAYYFDRNPFPEYIGPVFAENNLP